MEPSSVGLNTAMDLLYRDYGHPAIVATEYKDQANNWPRIANGDKAELRKYSIFLINLLSAKQGNHDLSSLDGYEYLKILASKLPLSLQQ